MKPKRHRDNIIKKLEKEGHKDRVLLEALRTTRRKCFLDIEQYKYAHLNKPYTINCKQIIPQPYMVAKMTELLLSKRKLKSVLEIGTSTGYQAAILSRLVKEVYTIESSEILYMKAKKNLEEYVNVRCFYGDGCHGLMEHAPFDGVIIPEAIDLFPFKLHDQMAVNSIAVYSEITRIGHQQLVVLQKKGDEILKTYHEIASFAPKYQ